MRFNFTIFLVFLAFGLNAQTRVLPAFKWDMGYIKSPLSVSDATGNKFSARHQDDYTKEYKKSKSFWERSGDFFKGWDNFGIGIDALVYRPLSIVNYDIGCIYRNTTIKIDDTYNTINSIVPSLNIIIRTNADPEKAGRLAFVVGGDFNYNFKFRQRDPLRNIISKDIKDINKTGFVATGGIFWNFTPGAGEITRTNSRSTTTRTATNDAYFNLGLTYNQYLYNIFSNQFSVNNVNNIDMNYGVIRFVFLMRGQFQGSTSF